MKKWWQFRHVVSIEDGGTSVVPPPPLRFDLQKCSPMDTVQFTWNLSIDVWTLRNRPEEARRALHQKVDNRLDWLLSE